MLVSRFTAIGLLTGLLLVAGAALFFADGRAAPGAAPTTASQAPEIAIEGDETFASKVAEALSLLREKAPADHAFVLEQVRLFRQAPRSGTHVEDGPCIVDLAMPTLGYSPTWAASVLVHESYHNKLYRDYAAEHGLPVPQHVYASVQAEQACNVVQMAVLRRVGAPQHEIDHLAQQDGTHFDLTGDGEYGWDDYEKRDW